MRTHYADRAPGRWLPWALMIAAACDPEGGREQRPQFQVDSPSDDDGGAEDGGGANRDAAAEAEPSLPSTAYCQRLAPEAEGAMGSGIDSPTDFEPTFLLIDSDATCQAVELTMGTGRCGRNDGHWLRFSFARTALSAGAYARGAVELSGAERSGAITVLYERPEGQGPDGLFGSCNRTEGLLNWTRNAEWRAGAPYSATFQLTLHPCSGTLAIPQDVIGSFDTRLPTTFCPEGP